jgi:hypothetical protein
MIIVLILVIMRVLNVGLIQTIRGSEYKMNYQQEVKPYFQHKIIHDMCEWIDQLEEKGHIITAYQYKQDLLHLIKNAVDLTSPVNRGLKAIAQKVYTDTFTMLKD